jgi:hypothetical protein
MLEGQSQFRLDPRKLPVAINAFNFGPGYSPSFPLESLGKYPQIFRL